MNPIWIKKCIKNTKKSRISVEQKKLELRLVIIIHNIMYLCVSYQKTSTQNKNKTIIKIYLTSLGLLCILICLGLIINHFIVFDIFGLVTLYFQILVQCLFYVECSYFIQQLCPQVRWNNCYFWLIVNFIIGWETDDALYNKNCLLDLSSKF